MVLRGLARLLLLLLRVLLFEETRILIAPFRLKRIRCWNLMFITRPDFAEQSWRLARDFTLNLLNIFEQSIRVLQEGPRTDLFVEDPTCFRWLEFATLLDRDGFL